MTFPQEKSLGVQIGQCDGRRIQSQPPATVSEGMADIVETTDESDLAGSIRHGSQTWVGRQGNQEKVRSAPQLLLEIVQSAPQVLYLTPN